MNVELAITLLWFLTLAQGVFLVVLYRQVGLHLLARGEAIVARDGPKIGQRIPSALVSEIERRSLLLASDGERSTLVIIFAREKCSVCLALWPELRRFMGSSLSADVALRVVFSAAPETTRLYRAEHALDYPFVSDPEEHIFDACRVRISPFAVVTDSSFTVRRKGLVNNREHLRALTGRQTSHSFDRSRESLVDRRANAADLVR